MLRSIIILQKAIIMYLLFLPSSNCQVNFTKVEPVQNPEQIQLLGNQSCLTENKVFVLLSVKIFTLLGALEKRLESIEKKFGDGTPKSAPVFRDCAMAYILGERADGIYSIDPDGLGGFDVFCDQTTAGGGWTVLQRRLDGSVDFYRNWTEYKRGFGDFRGEFWLGLEKINRLTRQTRNNLRVEIGDEKGNTAFAQYGYFAVGSERAKYQLSLGNYSGDAGDGLTQQTGLPFSTKDRDNDRCTCACAVKFKGAWWYNRCHFSNLNGDYKPGRVSGTSMAWYAWRNAHIGLTRSQMKIKPVLT